MNFNRSEIFIVTAFPDLLKGYLSTSVLGRGIEAGKLKVAAVDVRDFAPGSYRQIDDYSFGGGGMVLMAEPLEKALDAIAPKKERYVLYPSPQGVPLHQELIEDLYGISKVKRLVVVCGHYEGVDERFVQRSVDLEVSLGDFVLTGGELPALAIVDAVSRLVKGVVGRECAVREDSFYSGMLDHPHYTRPANYRDCEVPEVLLSGDARRIESFRRETAVERTLARRPDLLSGAGIMPYLKKGVYVIQLHHPVLDRNGNKGTTSITGMDLHDIARACRTYGVKKYLIVTPLAAQREMVKRIASHWLTGYGAEYNPDRSAAMRTIKTFAEFDKALAWVEKREKSPPYTIATTAKEREGSRHWKGLKRELLGLDRPVVFLFGTGSGLHDEIFERSSSIMSPIAGAEGAYNHLSVRSAASVVLDRFFGFR